MVNKFVISFLSSFIVLSTLVGCLSPPPIRIFLKTSSMFAYFSKQNAKEDIRYENAECIYEVENIRNEDEMKKLADWRKPRHFDCK